MNSKIKSLLLMTLMIPNLVFAIDFSAMTLNVDNLFDTYDDKNKDDKAYLPIELKQTETHINSCKRIPVQSWKYECLFLDCLLYTSPSPRDNRTSRMPSSA